MARWGPRLGEVTYRDEQTALHARVEALEREVTDAQREAQRLRDDNERLRWQVRRFRIGRGAVFAAVGGLAGLLFSAIPAATADNLRLLLPGALLGGLFGMLHGLSRDIDD